MVVMKIRGDLLMDKLLNNFADNRDVGNGPEIDCLGSAASLVKRDDDGALSTGRD